MRNTIETQELKEAKEQLTNFYEEAIEIVDIKGDEYIEEHLDEDDAERFKELVDTIFDYNDVLDTVDIDDIEDWSSQLEWYLWSF